MDALGLCKKDVENIQKWVTDNLHLEPPSNWYIGDVSGSDTAAEYNPITDTVIYNQAMWTSELTELGIQELANTVAHERLHKEHWFRDMVEKNWDFFQPGKNWDRDHQAPYADEVKKMMEDAFKKGAPPLPKPQSRCDCSKNGK